MPKGKEINDGQKLRKFTVKINVGTNALSEVGLRYRRRNMAVKSRHKTVIHENRVACYTQRFKIDYIQRCVTLL